MATTSISTFDLPRSTIISSTLSNGDISPVTVVNASLRDPSDATNKTRAQTHVRGTQTSNDDNDDDKENCEDSHGNEERPPHLHSNVTISHDDDEEEDDEKPTTTIANLMFLELQEAAHRNHFRLPRNEFAAWVPLLNKGFGGPTGGKVWVADITRDRYLYAGRRDVGRLERAAREKEGMRRFLDGRGEWRVEGAVVERKEYRMSRFSEVCFDVEGGCWRKLSEERVEVERNGGCTGEKGKEGKREWRKRIGKRVRGWWKRG
ncbi:MAG: hypothetical protein Q9178_003124 [Gyalolechia marmorata]